MLLLARPFAVGNRIRVQSGALGGEFYGTVTAVSLTYVSVLTDDGMLKVPFVSAGRCRRAMGPLCPFCPEANRPEPPVAAGAGPRSDPRSRSN